MSIGKFADLVASRWCHMMLIRRAQSLKTDSVRQHFHQKLFVSGSSGRLQGGGGRYSATTTIYATHQHVYKIQWNCFQQISKYFLNLGT